MSLDNEEALESRILDLEKQLSESERISEERMKEITRLRKVVRILQGKGE